MSPMFVNGHLSDEATARYAGGIVDGSLAELPESILSHVEECAECKDKIMEISMFQQQAQAADTDSRLEEMTIVRMPETRRWYQSSMRIAAVFFVGALLLSTYFLVYQDGAPLENIISGSKGKIEVSETGKLPVDQQKTEKKVKPQVQKKVPPVKTTPRPDPRFTVNPALEGMIGSQYRSAAVQVIEPEDNATITGDIIFQWKYTGGESLILKIIDNKNIVRHTAAVTQNRYHYKTKLTQGLYYWKLETQTDLLYTGKFKIK